MDQKGIGRFLRELRVGRGLTQEQAAAELGVSARTVSRWETGANLPDLEVLVCLADFYGVGIREVLDGRREDCAVDPQEKMNLQEKKTLIQAGDYARARLARRMGWLLGLGLACLTAYTVFDALDLAGEGAFGAVAHFCLGSACATMLLGLLYVTGRLAGVGEFKRGWRE